jgi:FkbM family methyltransferase
MAWDDHLTVSKRRGNTERIIKSVFNRQLKRSGLHLFTNRALPSGVDWLLDIKKLGLPTSATFFDVGANIGQTVFAVCESFPEARIFSFEPFPSTFRTLKERTAHLKHVRVFPLALGASPVTLQVNEREMSYLNSLVGTNKSTESKLPRSGVIPITVKTLDHFCAEHGVEVIDVLKTDTEGYDLEVLRGAEALLDAGRVHYIYTEVTFCAENRQNTPFAPLFDHLTAKNFHFLGLYETYPLHHFSDGSFVTSRSDTVRHSNDFNFFCNAMFVLMPKKS